MTNPFFAAFWKRWSATVSLTLGTAILAIATSSAQIQTPPPQSPQIAPSSDEGQAAIKLFVLPENVVAKLFAAEPLLANPVAIDVDFQNRVWVCESFRQEEGIEDNREHPEWLNDDLAAQTVADRIAYIRKHVGDEIGTYMEQDDQIRLLVDTDQDGVADRDTVFANRFNAIEDGTGAGVLSYRSQVYYTCIPKLYSLADSDNDGVADKRNVLHDGFGVRFAFRGHDLHGLIVGPDGRLYFSVGDRGYHINDQTKDPESGAVFRCELDGSDLQVVATGLRNPQELAFDNFGNLFTGDNNSDSGDRARMVYVVPGSDSGWRMSYQYLPDRGPFNREKIWHPYDLEVTPAYIVPPIDNFADGPSGFAHYPGTGFSKHLDDRFLLCDFRGQTTGSGIKTFRLKPKGAFFEIADEENTFWNILATDCCFAPDGRLFVSDWVHGWQGLGKGRVYTLTDSSADQRLIDETKALLSSDISTESLAKLLTLLSHADRRVRQEAQFELARRNAFFELNVIAKSESSKLLGRIHAIWALDQIARGPNNDIRADEMFAQTISQLLDNDSMELRGQAARFAGKLMQRDAERETSRLAQQVGGLNKQLIDRIKRDPSGRVKYFAMISLGQSYSSGLEAVFEALASNRNADPLLRHAGIMAIVHRVARNDMQTLTDAFQDGNDFARLAAVVAARKLIQNGNTSPQLRQVLKDALGDSYLVLESARAIHDLPIPELQVDLAAVESSSGLSDHLILRIMNANYRLGTPAALQRVVSWIRELKDKEDLASRGLQMLKTWNEPGPLDQVLGMWRPVSLKGRATQQAVAEQYRAFFNDFSNLPAFMQESLLDPEIVGRYQLPEMLSLLKVVAFDANHRYQVQATACYLQTQAPESLDDFVADALQEDNVEIRKTVLEYLVDQRRDLVVQPLLQAIQSNSMTERQHALQLTESLEGPEIKKMLLDSLTDFQAMPKDTQLDYLLAAQQYPDSSVNEAAAELLKDWESQDPDWLYKLTLLGGNADNGAEIFYNRTDVYCLRCHKIDDRGGAVGPELSKIGSEKNRQYLMESIVHPNRTIAENFDTVLVLDSDGVTHIGIKQAETDETLTIITAEGVVVEIAKDDIDDITGGKSAMPKDILKNLSLRDLRDLVEFMANRK